MKPTELDVLDRAELTAKAYNDGIAALMDTTCDRRSIINFINQQEQLKQIFDDCLYHYGPDETHLNTIFDKMDQLNIQIANTLLKFNELK